MAAELSDIQPGEVSLVHRGANSRRWALAKADETIVDDTIVGILEKAHDDEAALIAELEKAGSDEETVKAAVGAFRLLKSVQAELPEAAAELLGAAPAAPAPEPTPAAPVAKEDKDMPEGVPVQKDDGSWDLSGVPEEQRAGLEVILKAHDSEITGLRSELATEREQREEATAIAKAERERRETAEFIAKAEELEHIPLAAGEFGPVLKEISELVPAETFEKLETVLKGANAALEQSDLFRELGAGGTGGSDAETRIEKAAEQLRESDPDLTKEQAIAKALEQNPDLYVAYRREVA